MTWITDGTGRRWVDVPLRKQRKPGRALRFGDVKVGDQLMARWKLCDGGSRPTYFIVTDRWFDPVAGEYDPVAGQMVAVKQIGPDGMPRGSKRAHTVRGLASQRFLYADRDYIAFCMARAAGMDSGAVVGIGYAHAIRKRPKSPGGGL